jgi:hypothetical protein
VRGGDDAAEIERQQRDRRSREYTGDDGIAARRGNTACKCLLELDARGACVTADEDPAAAGPERGSAAETLDEVGGQVLADDATDTVRAEVLAHAYLLENCGALRALWSPAFLRSTIRASRVRKPARLSATRSSGSASTSARAMP